MKNLFIIRSPLQLLNAIEAISHFKLFNSDNMIYIIETNGISNNQQINDILNTNNLNNITRIKPTKKSNFLNYVAMLKKMKKNSYNYLFLGDYGSIHKVIISNLDAKNIFLLDDGTASITIHDSLINYKRNLKDTFKLFRFIPFGLSIKQVEKINFFTIFSLYKTDSIGVLKNEMEYLKSTYDIDNFTLSTDVCYLGQPFVESKVLSEKTYTDCFENSIKKHFIDNSILYFPHRGENIENTPNNLKNKFQNLEIINNTLPLEKYFLENKIYPNIIISVTSTALFTLKILFPKAKVYYIKIPEKDIYSNQWNDLKLVYQTLENSNIENLSFDTNN